MDSLPPKARWYHLHTSAGHASGTTNVQNTGVSLNLPLQGGARPGMLCPELRPSKSRGKLLAEKLRALAWQWIYGMWHWAKRVKKQQERGEKERGRKKETKKEKMCSPIPETSVKCLLRTRHTGRPLVHQRPLWANSLDWH